MERLNVIVAYRDREQQKDIFVDSLHKFLAGSKIGDFRIYIVEQNCEKEFNKGCLWNIGFLETANDEDNYYCFHDIDLLPKSPKASYQKPPVNSIVHPYGHKHCLGGKILINSETYKRINGFSTKYWGWGFEDDDFMLRAIYNGIRVVRDNFTERFNSDVYYELDAENNNSITEKINRTSSKVNQILFYNTVLDPSVTNKDGLTSTDYIIHSKEEFEKYTLLLCEIKNRNNSLIYIDSLQQYLDYVNS